MTESFDGLDSLVLVDHHVHGATRSDQTRTAWEATLTEAQRPAPALLSDSQLGLAIRRWCAPLLDLPPRVGADAYFARRLELGAGEINRRLLSAAGIGTFLLDDGFLGPELQDAQALRQASGATVERIVRIESVMERVTSAGVAGADFPEVFRATLTQACAGAVGVKSVIAYRHGLDFDPRRPSDADAIGALEQLPAPGARVTDPVLLRFGLWCGVDTGLPVQLHTGFGDPDLDLQRSDPSLLTPWLRMLDPAGPPVILLHCYPYHRQAGYLAQVFPHVYFDVGLAINHTGLRSDAVVAESLELAPFSKQLFATDACGPAELHYLGAQLWRRGMSRVLAQWVAAGEVGVGDAARIAELIGAGNARRVYGLI